MVHVSFDYVMVQGSVFNLRNGNVILERNVSRLSGTTRTTAYCMNTSKMAFVPKEDSKCTHSSLEIFLMIILTHTFSRREPKRLLVPRVEKAESSQS